MAVLFRSLLILDRNNIRYRSRSLLMALFDNHIMSLSCTVSFTSCAKKLLRSRASPFNV